LFSSSFFFLTACARLLLFCLPAVLVCIFRPAGRLLRQMFHELESSDGSEPAALERLMHTLVYEKLDMAEERLITPAKWPNFGHQHAALADHPFCDMKHCKMMDAGVHTNLPLPPLLRKERASDIIICLDQSSAPDIFSTVSIDIAARFAAEEKLACPDCSEALKSEQREQGGEGRGKIWWV